MRPLLLDLFCGAGGAAMGYYQAGFDVIGVDVVPQPRYPFRFVQADALTPPFDPSRFDAIHASPPCQAYSESRRLTRRDHPDLVAATRALLVAAGVPFVIENVPGAPLKDPVVLEGQMFDGLRSSRPRLFETNWPVDVPLLRPPRPRHAKMGRRAKPGEWLQVVGHFTDAAAGGAALGIGWMSRDELAQAVPPAYTRFLGEQLMLVAA